MSKRNKKKIVILGAGFGGMYCYLELHKRLKNRSDIEIVLIDKKNYFLFVPMIHEVATGNLEPSSIIQPLRQTVSWCAMEFVEGTVKSIDLDQRLVLVRTSKYAREITFDYLVYGLGSDAHFFDIPGAREHTLPLKTLEDAVRIKHRIIDAFEQATLSTDQEEQKRLLTFVLIGGGPTGVELAGEIADIVHHELRRAYPKLSALPRIHVIHSMKRLLEQAPEWFSNRSKRILEKNNVVVHLESSVVEVDKDKVILASGQHIDASHIFWTAGVRAFTEIFNGAQASAITRDPKTGRITAHTTLVVKGLDHVFAVGDALFLNAHETGQPYPMRAQFAVREGICAAKNIINSIDQKPLQKFEWNDHGFIISLGKFRGLAQILGIKFGGPKAWWFYRTAYLFKLVGLRAKLKTAYDWTINLFLPRDISKF